MGTIFRFGFSRTNMSFSRRLPDLAHTCVKELLADMGSPSDISFASGFDALHGIGQTCTRSLMRLQILSPYRAGYFGADELNRHIQTLLRAELLRQWRETLGKASGRRYVRHDKVLQTQNKRLLAREKTAWDRNTSTNVDLFVANGELGLVYQIERTQKTPVREGAALKRSSKVSVSVDEYWAEHWLDLRIRDERPQSTGDPTSEASC